MVKKLSQLKKWFLSGRRRLILLVAVVSMMVPAAAFADVMFTSSVSVHSELVANDVFLTTGSNYNAAHKLGLITYTNGSGTLYLGGMSNETVYLANVLVLQNHASYNMSILFNTSAVTVAGYTFYYSTTIPVLNATHQNLGKEFSGNYVTVGSGETLYISIVSQAITGNSTSAINITAVPTSQIKIPTEYYTTFNETGLPAGTAWYVDMNGTALRSTSPSVTFMVPNGTYAFTAGNVSPYTAYPKSGTVTVNGTAQYVNITYSKVVHVVPKTYNVMFSESGLPNGTSWSVTLNGTARTSVSSNTSFFLHNGTYSYTSGQVTGYSVSPASGTVTVNGTAQYVNITYSKVPTNVSIAPVNLGEASNFTILAETEVTSTGNTSITGNVGLSPAAASFITGFGLVMSSNGQYSTSTLVNGKVYAADYSDPTPAMLSLAVLDMENAYTSAADRPDPKAVGLGNGNLGGMTITPGLYKWTTGVTIPSNLILNGNANSVWIFQISGGLTVGSGAHVILTGGAQAKNVFWQVGSGVTLGTDSSFSGIILSKTLIAMDSGATLNGSALAQTAVTLIGDKVVSSAVPVSNVTNTSKNYAVSLAYDHWNDIGQENSTLVMSQYASNASLHWDHGSLNGYYNTTAEINSTWNKFFSAWSSVSYTTLSSPVVTVNGNSATVNATLQFLVQDSANHSKYYYLNVSYSLNYYSSTLNPHTGLPEYMLVGELFDLTGIGTV